MDWVTVGNAGYGAVGYSYQIGKYEVTNAQYGAFLNAAAKTDSYGLYNSSMSSYGITQSGSAGSYTYSVTTALANRPVVFVSWFDAARMANWMMNGQGGGSTETGAYTLNGAIGGIVLANAGAQVYIPTENEWYKAAYYNSASQTYSLFPNGQNSITGADANYWDYGVYIDDSGNQIDAHIWVASSTDVGAYSGDPSTYGTFDQGGNVWEWNDGVVYGTRDVEDGIYGSSRGLRGGSWLYGAYGNSDASLASSYGNHGDHPSQSYESEDIGFRLASVPEPSSLVLTMLASGVILIRRRR
jgi:sulfatase modifying factor 1